MAGDDEKQSSPFYNKLQIGDSIVTDGNHFWLNQCIRGHRNAGRSYGIVNNLLF